MSGDKASRRRSGSLARSVLALGALCLLLLAQTPALAEGVGDYKCTDCDKVYHGNPRLFKKPCEISADEVYKHIPEYKQILDKGLTDKDVEYHFLMKKASQRFTDAVKQMARDLDYDLVAEKGTIKKAKDGAKDIPDATDDVVKNIR
jgi:4-diphosphocytidyl-2C-methyl-D-erythritol kinase